MEHMCTMHGSKIVLNRPYIVELFQHRTMEITIINPAFFIHERYLSDLDELGLKKALKVTNLLLEVGEYMLCGRQVSNGQLITIVGKNEIERQLYSIKALSVSNDNIVRRPPIPNNRLSMVVPIKDGE